MKITHFEYFIGCFNRVLQITFANKVDFHNTFKVIDEAYFEWFEEDQCETCEEFIIRALKEKGYNIISWTSID